MSFRTARNEAGGIYPFYIPEGTLAAYKASGWKYFILIEGVYQGIKQEGIQKIS